MSVLRITGVKARVGLGRSSIYERLNPSSQQYDPTFPRPFSLGRRAKGWLESEVDEWVHAQAAKRSAISQTGKHTVPPAEPSRAEATRDLTAK